MVKLIATILYADLGLDVVENRFRLIATGNDLVEPAAYEHIKSLGGNNVDHQVTAIMSEKASQLAVDYIDALAIDDGAILMDDVMKKQFEECPTGFCPDIKAAYEAGHGCVLGGGEAHKNDSIKLGVKGDNIFNSDPEASWLVDLGLAVKEY